MVPEGTEFQIGAGLRRGAPFAPTPAVAKDIVRVNDFTIEYLPNGQVSQFFSDLSVVDSKNGREIQRKTISVNVPLREGGVTMYQTDWEIASMQVRVAEVGFKTEDAAATSQGDSGPAPEAEDSATSGSASVELPEGAGESLSLPMANLEGKGNFQGRIWGTFLPLNPDSSDPVEAKRGVTLLARDFQSVAIYASDGSFAGVRRPGSGRPIEVDGLRLVIEDMKGSTGLELKTDPGVPWVYAAAGLMVTSFCRCSRTASVGGGGGRGRGVAAARGRQEHRVKEEFKSSWTRCWTTRSTCDAREGERKARRRVMNRADDDETRVHPRV